MDDVAVVATPAPKKSKNRGNMFLVDVPTYAAVCGLGDPDVAAVYLILAAGTGADNRTSTWSREAVNKRTGLNWRKASGCFDKLERAGLLRWITGKSTRKPRLDLPPIETRPAMQKHVAALADRIMHGEQPTTATEKGAATIGKDHGWLDQDDAGTWYFVSERPMVKAYLPNSLVGDETGKPISGSTIVDRIRLARDPMTFRLLVDLYALQDLAELGGVDRWFLRKKFARRTITRTGTFQVWEYSEGSELVRVQGGKLSHHARKVTEAEKAAGWNSAKDFFPRVKILEDAGALEWVYYLAEDDTETSVLIHPLAVERHGKVVWSEIETIVGSYATRAACALAEMQGSIDGYEGLLSSRFLLAADRLAREATVVGIPRLRCRAKTTNAARWRKELVDDAMSHIGMFRGIINEHAPELLAKPDSRLADFNGISTKISTETSTLVQRDINDSSWSGRHEGSVLRTADDTASPSPFDWSLPDDDAAPFTADGMRY